FMSSMLGFEMGEGYGVTESAARITIDNRLVRPPATDYKLVDVPGLGYFGTDKPYPRGELLIKSDALFTGYFKRQELTAEVFDADGFYRTGDIMAELGPDHLVYVDRRNNVLKLSQGEFVSVSKLEAVYTATALIHQIFVHGNSEHSYLLAVIVPTSDAIATYPDTSRLSAAITESLHRAARDAGLNSYEIPRAFLLETEPFSGDNGLLSSLGKLLRPKLKQRYGGRLEQLYADLVREQSDDLAALRSEAEQLPVPETVARAARALLGIATEPRPDMHFADLGGDSLSALTYSTLLQEIFGIDVPVGLIVGPATDLARLATYIEGRRSSSTRRVTLTAVHGKGTRIRASDLTLDKFIDAPTLAATRTLPRATGRPKTVLLTGANGYLGRFLCLEWLQRLDHCAGDRLICLVRGTDSAAARTRLDEVFHTGDDELSRCYRVLSEHTLKVLAGDVGEPNLGLDDHEWHRLADTVDLIVHPAALVNHLLPYSQLFGPNVVGTAEMIRLALTSRIKPMTYLSTVAVVGQVAPEEFTEDGDIREMSAVRSLDDDYASGYGNSKWAGEVLLREAHDLCRLPVAVFRSDMILAHSRYAGQLNVPDSFTRLMLSVLSTGLAPKSFYLTDSHGNRQRSHYDGLPSDFIAEAIIALGAEVTEGFETFNVINPHDDGVSLDQFVDWLIEAGHRIDRIEDYEQWFARFETAVRALPEQERRHSLLPLLHTYRSPTRPNPGAQMPARKFQSAVQAAGLSSHRDIPHVTRDLIVKYPDDLRKRKLFGTPD
ncbi:MAG: thioester reductase domain-containing protein, partial [Mycobacterium sp.]|nr:thioester reductase domain-containing protein [Mycobacterium sp.]